MLCDFDGTISKKDTVNRLVRTHLTAPEWRFVVKQYLRGDIGSKGVYEAVQPLLRLDADLLDKFVLEHAELDPHFPAFLDWAKKNSIDVKVVSDGFDATIAALFRNHDIDGLDIYANNLGFTTNGVTINNPHANPECGVCGTCKLRVLDEFRADYDTIILIGDGESDRHAASKADLVLGLKDLFIYCARQGIPAIGIDGFQDVPNQLSREIKAVTYDLDGTLVDSLSTIWASFNHMFRTLGYPEMTKEEVARKTSLSLLDFVKGYLQPDEAEQGVRIFREYYSKIFLEQTLIMPGAHEVVHDLDGSVIQGIITNKKGVFARSIARNLDISTPMSLILGAEDGYKAKPAADMFHKFMETVSVTENEIVYVGDSPVDVVAAKNAGIDAFAVAGPVFSPEELALLRPRRVLRSISELPSAVAPVVSNGERPQQK